MYMYKFFCMLLGPDDMYPMMGGETLQDENIHRIWFSDLAQIEKFTELNISGFQFFNFIYISYHWEIFKYKIISGI